MRQGFCKVADAHPHPRPLSRRERGARPPLISKIAAIFFISLLVFSGGVTLRHAWPALAAWVADTLRGFVGHQAVASLETFVFQQEDTLHQTLQSFSSSSGSGSLRRRLCLTMSDHVAADLKHARA